MFSPVQLKDLFLSSINPLRGLTIQRAIAELEAGERGDYAMLQWLYRYIEKRDATLRGAKRRLIASILKLDWDIKIPSTLDPAQEELAQKQQKMLRAEYEKITNFKKALRHLAMTEFRGYAHLEKVQDATGSIVELTPVPQWHFCRDGLYGEWRFNEDAARGGITGEPLDPSCWVIREIDDPIDEIALIAFTRKGLSQKDFDAFIARFGLPFVFWVMGESMAQAIAQDTDKLAEYQSIMRGISGDNEGIFPGGSLETLTLGGNGQGPFLDHIKHQDEQIVMAATSGRLTMLAEATGMNSGNADAHADTFDELAIALAMEISETLQEQMDQPLLNRLFPGQPKLAYFELAAKSEEDVKALAENVKTLDEAGFEADALEISEKAGLKLTRKIQQPAPGVQTLMQKNRLNQPVSGGAENRKSLPVSPDKESMRKAAASVLTNFDAFSRAMLAAGLGDDTATEKLLTEAVIAGATNDHSPS